MLGKRKSQGSFFTAEAEYLEKVGRESFYGYLAVNRHRIFRDDDYAELYCLDNGRESVPPSIAAVALLLQTFDRVSDAEVVERATFDVRWCVALGTEVGKQPFAKSTFQAFRAKLIVNEKAKAIFERSLSYARQIGFLKNRKVKVALDSFHIFGKGAVKDTYNLLADGIRKLVSTLENLSVNGLSQWLHGRRQRYFGKSFKGEAEIDWDDAEARQALLETLVSDIKSLLELASEHQQHLSEDAPEHQKLQECMRLLCDLVQQDVEQSEDGQVCLKQGVAKDRIISVHDPEIRHGRKSKRQRFDGHKGAIAVETETSLISAVGRLAGNAHDGENALELCEQSEENLSAEVDTALGDSHYGTGELRKDFSKAEIDLIAKVPKLPGDFSKEHFNIDLKNNNVTCHAGKQTSKWRSGSYKRRDGTTVKTQVFIFGDDVCARCEFYHECVKSRKGKGRTITLHPEEALLQQARAFQKTETFKEQYRQRTTVEHRIARLMQLGMRKSRYFGGEKTEFQLAMAAAVANFTLIAAWQLTNPDYSILILTFALAIVNILAKLTFRRYASSWLLKDVTKLTHKIAA